MRFPLIAIISLVPACAGAEKAEPGSPDWLAGYWLSCDEGRQTVEAWIADGSGALVGVNQSKGAYEFLRIAEGETGFAYHASPGGAPATVFTMTSNSNQKAVFENPSHDFPQIVAYERTGETLVARIEGAIGAKREAIEWKFSLAAMGERCK